MVVPANTSTVTTFVGAAGGSGAIDADFTLPALPAGLDGTTAFTQLVTADASGQTTLGGASALTWLSAVY